MYHRMENNDDTTADKDEESTTSPKDIMVTPMGEWLDLSKLKEDALGFDYALALMFAQLCFRKVEEHMQNLSVCIEQIEQTLHLFSRAHDKGSLDKDQENRVLFIQRSLNSLLDVFKKARQDLLSPK